MTKKPTLALLKEQIDSERRPQLSPSPSQLAEANSGQEEEDQRGRLIRGKRYPTYREGKVPISGYFSFELNAALHDLANAESLAKRRRVKIQELLGEAIDLLLQSRGKHPFGER